MVKWSREVKLDPSLFTKVLKVEAIELRAIVSEYLFLDSKVVYDVLPNEVLHFDVLDLVECFSLNPLSKVVSDC